MTLKRFIFRIRLRLFALLFIGIALLLIGVLSWLWEPREGEHAIRIAGGVEGLNRYGVAAYVRRHTQPVEVDVDIVPCEGSVVALRMVENREADMALVNGLVRNPSAKSVRQVAQITTEALHLLVKQEHALSVQQDFDALRDLTINVGPAGSEAAMVSRSLLAFCGINLADSSEEAAPSLDHRGLSDLLSKLDELERSPDAGASILEDFPDVVIHVSSLPSPLAQALIRDAGYQLVATPFAEAFSRVTVEEDEWNRDHVDQVHVVHSSIPAYMYSASPPVPEKNLPTLGFPLVLVAHEDVPAGTVSRILPLIFEGPIERTFAPPSIESSKPTYPWHQASIDYRDGGKPLLRADLANLIQSLVGVMGPILGGCFALYTFYRWRHTLRFIEYFEAYQVLDTQAKGLTSDDVVTPAEENEARRLEAELTRLQQRAVSDFCRNYFHGDGVLENFLGLLAETRDFLRSSTRKSEG